jgi:hypothetical protein
MYEHQSFVVPINVEAMHFRVCTGAKYVTNGVSWASYVSSDRADGAKTTGAHTSFGPVRHVVFGCQMSRPKQVVSHAQYVPDDSKVAGRSVPHVIVA